MTDDEPELEGPKRFLSKFHVYHQAGGQIIGNNANTDVTYANTLYDQLGEVNLANGRFTPRKGGWYFLAGSVRFAASGLGTMRTVDLILPGQTLITSVANDFRGVSHADWHKPYVAAVVRIPDGSYARLACLQNTGGNLALFTFYQNDIMFQGHRLS